MILPGIGSLNQVSSLSRFQRRLESPHPPHMVCHSRDCGNLTAICQLKLSVPNVTVRS
jgi:hypothetical protein